MTPSWYLVALAFVLGAAVMFVLHDVVGVVRRTGRHADTGVVDLTVAAARGELLHLDWGDQRANTETPTGAIIGEAFERGRHLSAVRDDPA